MKNSHNALTWMYSIPPKIQMNRYPNNKRGFSPKIDRAKGRMMYELAHVDSHGIGTAPIATKGAYAPRKRK